MCLQVLSIVTYVIVGIHFVKDAPVVTSASDISHNDIWHQSCDDCTKSFQVEDDGHDV